MAIMRIVWRLRILPVALLLTGMASAQQNLNMTRLKADIRVYEGIVQDVVTERFSHPFALESRPLAAYLQDYGIVVSLHLNINRAAIRDPFRSEPEKGAKLQDQMAGKARDEQVEQVRQLILTCLADYGGSALRQLSANDKIVISAHVEDRNELNRNKRNTVLVVTAKKDDIDLLSMRRIDREEFRSRVHVLQY